MRTLLWRVTLSHLLVSLGALGLLALLSPYFFRAYYARAESRQANAAVSGLAHAASGLVQAGAPSPNLDTIVRNSAGRLGAEVLVVRGSTGEVLSSAPAPRGLGAGEPLELVRPLASDVRLVVRLPLTGLAEILKAQRLMTLAAAGLAALLAVALAVLLSRPISAPLVAMSRAAERLAAEDFSVRVPEAGPLEVASLARSLNHMAAELQQAFEEMRRLDQLRREFVGNASHELRAPLTNIRGFLGAVLDGTAETDEQQVHCLRTASREAERMTRIVEELLQLSRLQADVLRFDLLPQDLETLARGVVGGFAPRLREARVSVAVEAQPLPPVLVDADKLAQVLVNLLDNALRYSPPGGTIRLVLAAVERGVRVTVADEGPGIPPADLPQIWERFHKADPARPRNEPGAGLGLAIVREIVRRHGGEVFARNGEAGGAQVGFVLPPGGETAELESVRRGEAGRRDGQEPASSRS